MVVPDIDSFLDQALVILVNLGIRLAVTAGRVVSFTNRRELLLTSIDSEILEGLPSVGRLVAVEVLQLGG